MAWTDRQQRCAIAAASKAGWNDMPLHRDAALRLPEEPVWSGVAQEQGQSSRRLRAVHGAGRVRRRRAASASTRPRGRSPGRPSPTAAPESSHDRVHLG